MKQIILSVYFLTLFYSISVAQNNDNYELVEVSTKANFYNFTLFNNQLYIGSDKGAYIINEKNETRLDRELIGYLQIEKDKIISKGSMFVPLIEGNEKKFNYLLPENSKNLLSRYTIYNKKLYIINANKLYSFVKTNYHISNDSISVRSISNHFIGSYNGIFKDGLKLQYPKMTDGYIREIENEVFICYNGLYRDSAGQSNIYQSSEGAQVELFNQKLGAARDIVKIDSSNYILFTNKGVFRINFIKKQVERIYKIDKFSENISYAGIEKHSFGTTLVYFTSNNSLFSYDINIKLLKEIINGGQSILRQVIVQENSGQLYALFQDKLSLFTFDQQGQKYTEEKLVSNLSFAHNLLMLDDKFVISTNAGLHVYSIKAKKIYWNIIPFETNNRSLSLVNDTVKVGTINGIANMSKKDIENAINDYVTNNQSIEESNVSLYKGIILFLVIGMIIFTFFHFSKVKKLSVPENKVLQDGTFITKENIVDYINNNITTVSNKSICDKFNISNVKLYEILDDVKPGEVIRNQRIELVRKFRKEKKEEQFIADNTGFSVSYLKKIY